VGREVIRSMLCAKDSLRLVVSHSNMLVRTSALCVKKKQRLSSSLRQWWRIWSSSKNGNKDIFAYIFKTVTQLRTSNSYLCIISKKLFKLLTKRSLLFWEFRCDFGAP